MKRLKYILLFFLGFTLSGCPEYIPPFDTELKVYNDSEKEILFMSMYKSIINNDTILNPNEQWYREFPTEGIVPSGSFGIEMFDESAMRYNIDENNDTYMIYIFDKDSLEILGWKEIAAKNMVLKRIDFDSYEDIELANFEIRYP